MILSSSLLAFDAKNGLVDWNNELKKVTDVKFRRAGRFAQAVLAGALLCVQKSDVKDFAIYFGTANGDVESTEKSQDSIFLHSYFPQPFSFINTLSNTSIFFLLQHLKLNSIGISLAHSHLAFEKALSLALCDLNSQRVNYALVGVSDVRHELPNDSAGFADKTLHEFSAWLLLSKDERNNVKFFDNFDELLEHIKTLDKKIILHIVDDFSDDEKNSLSKYVKVEMPFVPKLITNRLSALICDYFSKTAGTLFCAGKDPRGGYSFVNLYQ